MDTYEDYRYTYEQEPITQNEWDEQELQGE